MKYLKYILCFLIITLPLFAQERVPVAPDTEEQTLSFFFKGAWLPDLDPAEIGPDNYAELKNLRYGPGPMGLEGVQGYSKINTTVLSTYTKIRSGIQLETDDTTPSYVLVQAENSAEDGSRVLVNSTAIPDQGDFSTSIELDTSAASKSYRDDSSGAGLGRWSEAPNSSVTYCNGVECLVWSGEEMRVAAFFTLENVDPYHATAYPQNETEAVNNALATTGNTVAIGTGSRDYFIVMATRPLQGVYFDVSTANETTAVLDIYYWQGDASPAWTALSESDGTLDDGKTLAQDGWVTWNSISDEGPYHYQGNYLYAYLFYVNAAAATIQYVSVNSPMQPIVDLWDGVPRQPIKFEVYRGYEGVFRDYTLEVNEYSYEDLPRVAQLDGLRASGNDYLIIMSEGKLSGINFDFMEGWTNTTGSTIAVLYWNGSAYANLTEFDGTALGGATMGQSGLVWWHPPSDEQQKTEFGVTGYSYKVNVNTLLSGTYRRELTVTGTADGDEVIITTSAAHNLGNNDVVTVTGIVGTTEANGTWAINVATATTFELIGSVYVNEWSSGGKVIRVGDDIMSEPGDVALDVVTCIPAQLKIKPFKFPSIYKNMTLLCGYIQGKEGNRCDFSIPNTTEGWNGALSSDDGTQSLHFGGGEDLTAGAQIYNRYGSQVITLWTAFKENETYVLKGDSPEDFKIERVSSNIGCPAPLTLASVEVAFELAEGVKRNMLFWLDASGVYSFDGQVLAPIRGIDKYFDSDDPDCINFDEISRSSGWYDPSKKEYNLLIPVGTSQATNNTWLVYDLLNKKWFRKDTGVASFPQVGFPVNDIYGARYIYGGIDSGFMMHLENGQAWDGTPIEQVVETGDFWPTGNVWDLTRIRKIKFMAKRILEEHQITIQHASDTDSSLGLSGIWMDDAGLFEDWEGGEWVSAALASIDVYMSDSINRIARDTVRDNLFGWSHRFEFSISTDETTKGLQPLGWGIVFQKEDRFDE